jgi:hypothetical protein
MWITLDDDGNEHQTKVHEVACLSQHFNGKEFICKKKRGELCSERCKEYANLDAILEEA